ncbi:MAG TPA: hypothetical protein VNA88_18505 [Candidatus Kapabacteria bacterium]|nr:hypothetical protein [Candidatus Kapabacteria bacterium]
MNTDYETRLLRLERSNLRYRRALIALVAGVVGVGAMAMDGGTPDVVRARRFEVIDTSGMILAELGTDVSGGRVVVGRRGGGSGMLFTNAEGGAIGLQSPDGKVPFRAGVSPMGGLLVLTNRADQFVMMAAADDSSGGAMVLFDRNGRELWHAP